MTSKAKTKPHPDLSRVAREAKHYELGNVVEILAKATCMHVGWESDNEIFLTRLDTGGLLMLSTNHGSICRYSAAQLAEKIKETRDSLDELNALKSTMASVGMKKFEE